MPNQQPNVIIRLTGAHRGDHLGLAGHPMVGTPNIDNTVKRDDGFSDGTQLIQRKERWGADVE